MRYKTKNQPIEAVQIKLDLYKAICEKVKYGVGFHGNDINSKIHYGNNKILDLLYNLSEYVLSLIKDKEKKEIELLDIKRSLGK